LVLFNREWGHGGPLAPPHPVLLPLDLNIARVWKQGIVVTFDSCAALVECQLVLIVCVLACDDKQEFEDARDADDAVYDLNGKVLCGERYLMTQLNIQTGYKLLYKSL